MWINDTFIIEKNVVTVEPYIMDCSYGIKVNDIPIEIERSESIYSKEEKEGIKVKIKENYIQEIINANL